MTTKLIGSAPSLDMLINEIKKRWYWSSVPLTQVSNNQWVINDDLMIKLKGKRYRLEMVIRGHYENS